MSKYDYFVDKKISALAKLIHWLFDRRQIGYIKRHKTGDYPRILEIGVGTGRLGIKLLKAGYRYDGIDESDAVIQHCLRKHGFYPKKFHVPPIPYAPNCLDFVILNHVLEHSTTPGQALQLLEEIERVLKPGGKLLLTAPAIEFYSNDFWAIDYTHTFPVSSERLFTMFRDAGLEISTCKLFYGGLVVCIGWPLDMAFSALFGLLARLFPGNPKWGRAKILFRPDLYVIGMKK